MSASPPVPTVNAPEVCEASVRLNAGTFSFVRRCESFAVPLGAAIVYLVFPTRNYYWDGINFAATIEESAAFSRNLIHPHHLLYNVFGFLIYRLAHAIGWEVRAIDVLQGANAVISALCVLLLWRILTRSLGSKRVATIVVAAFSFSATWWKYSTDVDSYISSIFFLLVCLDLVLTARKIKPVMIALAHTASMCLHQLAVFFAPVIVISIFLREEDSWRERMRQAIKYAASATFITLAINYYCFHLVTRDYSVGSFGRWLTFYVQGPDRYSFSFDLLSNFGFTARAQVRLFFEGRVNWLHGLVSPPTMILVGTLIVLVAILLMRVAPALPRLRSLRWFRIQRRFRRLVTISVVWIGVYVVFLFFWYPYFTPYRLFLLPAILCLAGVLLAQVESLNRSRSVINAGLLVAAMALSNFLFFIFPLTHVEKYPPLDFAIKMNQSWPSGSVIYYFKSNADNQLVKYFNPQTAWRSFDLRNKSADEHTLGEIYRSGGSAWLETSALDQIESSSSGRDWLSVHAHVNCRKELVNGSYHMKYVQIFPESGMARINSDCALLANVHEDLLK